MKTNMKSFTDGFVLGFYSFTLPNNYFSTVKKKSDSETYKSYWENVGEYIKKGISSYAQN